MALAASQQTRAGAEAVDLLTAQPGRRARFDAEQVADVADSGMQDARATDAIVGTGLWQRTETARRRVYQRDDLIDPARVDQDTGLTNMRLVEAGRPPVGPDGRPLNLHHMTQDEPGPMAEVTATIHQENFATLHLSTSQHGRTYRGPDGERHPYQSVTPAVDSATDVIVE
jgi:hypothetical protein